MLGTARNAALLIAITSVCIACADSELVPAQGPAALGTIDGVEPSAEVPADARPNASGERVRVRVIEEVGLTTAAVVGGKESAPCGWPSTVDISGCTGTLIHPRVVTSAAHCLVGRSTAPIKFTAGKDKPGSFTLTGQCKTGGFFGGGSADWGYCVIPEDPRVKMMQITPPLAGCEAERFLKPGNSAWIVGFGETGANKGDNGIKREVEVKINRVSNGTVDVGNKEFGACHGDSGGPLYIKLSDGTHDWGWRTAGSTSGAGDNCDCCTTTVFVDMRQHVKAIEMNEKIDVTPCTDDSGKWAPGPDCKDIITDPGTGTGTYPMCTAPVTREPIASCGEPLTGSGAAGATASPAGAAGRGAAGSGSAAAGSGGPAAAAGAGGAMVANAPGSPSIAGAGANVAGSVAAPAAGGGARLGQAGVGAAATTGFGVTTAPATTTPMQSGAAGRLGTGVNAVTGAGAPAVATQSAPTADSGGCQISRVGSAQRSGSAWLFGALLVGLATWSIRSRQRRMAS